MIGRPLTAYRKAEIDAMTYENLLRHWRLAAPGDPCFQGEEGAYWARRMAELRAADPGGHVAASKAIGWGR